MSVGPSSVKFVLLLLASCISIPVAHRGFQAYVERLATISPTTLSHSGLKLVVIGCGDYQPIKSYAGMTYLHDLNPL